MEDAIICFSTGEMYWEFARFAPYVIWKKEKQYKKKNIKFIIITDPTRFDIYGRHASILVPFRLNQKYKQNCFRLDNVTIQEYLSIIESFKNQFKDRYNLLEIIYPDISKNQYSNKNQFPRTKMSYNYLPRLANKELINKHMDEKPIIVLAPRYREGFKRNWPYWTNLYDLISNNEILMKKYNFVIVGKNPDYIPDNQNRFFDINTIEQNINTSTIGLTIECLKKSVLTIGSQSAIPNISLLFGVHALEWGHQKHLHTVVYNIRRTKVTFLDDHKYQIKPEIIYNEMLKILK